MSSMEREEAEQTVLMTREAISDAVNGLAQGILDANEGIGTFVLLGILTRGRPLADRIADRIEAALETRPRVGSLATTLYRDDLRSGKGAAKMGPGETHFDFDVDGVTVVLIDDVLASGRTVRAALDEVMDYGRPARVQLACLIDRGLRELPIRADYLGVAVQTCHEDHVAVRLDETDGEDVVLLEQNQVQG